MKNLKINKDDRDVNFTTISLTIYDDDRLSWRAKGLHTYLISRPNNWELYENDLLNRSKDGRTSLRSALKELVSLGYLTIEQRRDKNGKFFHTFYEVYESPQSGFPLTGKPSAGNDLLSIYNISNNKDNKELFTNVNNSASHDLQDVSKDELKIIIKILNHYNMCVDKIKHTLSKKGVNLGDFNLPIKHKSIYSKCTISLPTAKSKAKSLPLIYILYTYIKTEPIKLIYEALDNYTEVFISNVLGKNKYYYNTVWKSLGQFIYSGLKHNTGYKSLLDLDKLKKNISNVDKIRKNFKPITKQWDRDNILDIKRNTYYGFPTRELKNDLIVKEDIKDILEICNNGVLPIYGYFEKLERAISSLFFTRKGKGLDTSLVINLLRIWENERGRWKRIVKEMNK